MARKAEQKEEVVAVPAPVQRKFFYSPKTKGFYTDAVHEKSSIPRDAIAITEENYNQLLDDQAAGKVIGVDEYNRPCTTDREFTQSDKEAFLKSYRFDKETGGIKVSGKNVPSDEKTERRISMACVQAQSDKDFKLENWTTGDTVETLSAKDIKEISAALSKHFQACFAAQNFVMPKLESMENEKQISEAFDAKYKALT